MTVVPLHCPHCQGAIQVDIAHAGAQVSCPHCQGLLTVPEFGASPPEPTESSPFDFTRRRSFDFRSLESPAAPNSVPPTFGPPAPPPPPPPAFGAAEELISLNCPLCSGLFQAPVSAGGQQVACPHCNGLVTLPAFAPAPPNPMPPGIRPPNSGLQLAPLPAPLPPGPLPPVPGLPLPPASPAPPAGDWQDASQGMPPVPVQLSTIAPVRSPEPKADDRLPPKRQPAKRESPSKPSSPQAEQTSQQSGVTPRGPKAERPLPTSSSARSESTLTPSDRQGEKRSKKIRAVDDLLPPGADPRSTENSAASAGQATETTGAPSSSSVPPKRPTEIDTLLPPGAGEALPSEVSPGVEVAIPGTPRKSALPPTNVPEGAAVVPTPEGGYATIRKKAKTVGHGDDEVELRELTPEEKAKKRFRYNLVMWSVCFLILFTVFLVLVWPSLTK